MDAVQNSEAGMLIQRAMAPLAVLKLGIRLGLDELRADEFYAMLILAEEQERLEHEKLPRSGHLYSA